MAALAFVLPALVVVPPASGSGSAHVDAGSTVASMVDVAFPLSGAVEGFAGPPVLAWSADADCMVLDPAALSTEALCSTPGPHVFTLLADDGMDSASDTVRVEVRRESSSRIALLNGTALASNVLTGVSISTTRSFQVPAGLTRMVATLDWQDNSPLVENLDLVVSHLGRSVSAATSAKPEVAVVEAPNVGPWNARVDGRVALNTPWTLDVTGVVSEGAFTPPTLRIPGLKADAGESVTLTLVAEGAAAPYAVAWETDAASRRFDDGAGETLTLVVTGTQTVLAKLTDAEGREFVATGVVHLRGAFLKPLTVVAVIDSSYSPYHYDFLGSQHPWNLDDDASNDIDFTQHPRALIPAAPDATALPITLPTSPDENVNALRENDSALWATMAPSTSASPQTHWFPGTKVIAAARFGNVQFQSTNAAHGSASASVAIGNVHGTCPECLVVLLNGNSDEAIRWATAQPWIDVITNSYGQGSLLQTVTLGFTRDNAYWRSPTAATRAASEAGQVIVFSAGNGFANAFDVPMFTYWSSQKGPDWMVTVGAVSPNNNQTYSGAGKPVDISSIGSAYPASGGTTANGAGTHGGTSNAAPVTAGTFAKVLQEAREALGDLTPGHADGIVASGTPVACGVAVPDCVLGDGVLTRVELEDLVYANVQPTTQRVAVDLVWPSTPYAYYYQGHGTLFGRYRGDATWHAEIGRMVDNMKGDGPSIARPAGETNWFVIDSKCRQKLWGAWSGGDYTGVQPALDPQADPIASAMDAWCSRAPDKPFPTFI